MTKTVDNRYFIICTSHKVANDWAQAKGMVKGMYKTITLASSLIGVSPHAKVLYLDTPLAFPEARAFELELKRFTNVIRLTLSQSS